MNLKLTIYTDMVWGPYTLREDGGSDIIPALPYSYKVKYSSDKVSANLTMVEAELEGDFDGNCEYHLQVGLDPDVIAKVKMGDGSSADGRRTAVFRSKWNDDWNERFPLFQQVMYGSRIRLFEMRYDENRVLNAEREILCVPVYIEPPPEKIKRLKQMIKDLQGAPQFFLDDFRGQMLLSCYSTIWDAGYSSHNDAKMELDAVKDVLDKIRLPMKYICQAPKTAFGYSERMIEMERVRCCHGRNRRILERLRESFPASNRIPATVKSVSNNVLAHVVIKEFFAKLMRRCDDIILEFISLRNETKREISELTNLYKDNLKDPAYLGTVAGKSKDLIYIEQKIKESKSLKLCAAAFHKADILRDSTKSLTIFDVDGVAFSGGVGYEKAYRIILEFERRRFRWENVKSRKYKIPKIKIHTDDKGGENKWVRKYSLVYEFWCYHRLIRALNNIATRISDEWLSPEQGARCVFRLGDIELELLHGFSAKENAACDDAVEFWLEPQSEYGFNGNERKLDGAKERTPDFAFIFTHVKTHKTEWIVADAKSHEKMNYKQIIMKREKYLHFVKHRVPSDKKGACDASQSWMFYAGEEEPGGCGVECPPRHSPSLRDGQFDSQAEISTYSFSPNEGIISERDRLRDLPRGHVHANIESLGDDNKPFEDFIKGEFATMERELS